MIIDIHICCRDEHGYMINGSDRFDFMVNKGGDRGDLFLSIESIFYPPKLTRVGYYGAKGHRVSERADYWNDSTRWIKVGSIWLKLYSQPRSGGNIFWDWVQTFPCYAVELLNYLHDRGDSPAVHPWTATPSAHRRNFSCTEGITELYDWWNNSNEPMTELRLAENL